MESNAVNVDELVKMLDGFVEKEESRMKITISEDVPEGEVKKSYHLGRCDINSPWDCGTAFSNQEEK